MLRDAKAQCDKLIVGLQTDPTLDRPEKNKPIQSYEERYIQLEAIKYVDDIIKYETEEELYQLLKVLMPDVRILGSDYKDGRYFTGDDLDIKIYYHDRNHNYSSSNLREKIKKS
jgi:glycerol-3-phosphate cytidylyltransferase